MNTIGIEIYRDNVLIGVDEVNVDTPLVDIANGIKIFINGTSPQLETFLCLFSSHHWERPVGPVAMMPTPGPPTIDVLVPNDLYIDSYRAFTVNDVSRITNVPEIINSYPPIAFHLVANNKIRIDIMKPKCGLTRYV